MPTVRSGEALNIPADVWNVLEEFALDRRTSRAQEGGPGWFDPLRAQWRVQVRNQSGAVRRPFDVLGITAALAAPEVGPLAWMDRPTLDGGAPTSTGAYVALLDGAAAGEIVSAVLAGLATVYVNVTDTAHAWAKPTAGDSTQLASDASTGNRILWKQSAGTGSTLAVILLVPGVGTAAAGGTGGTEKVASKTADFTVASTDDWTLFLVDCSGAGISLTATLPALATGTNAGFRVGFQKTDSSTKQLNINTSTGSGVTTLTEQSDGCVVEWSGSAWVVLSRNTRQLLNVASAAYLTYTNPTTTFTRANQQWYGGHQSFTATGNDTTSINSNWHAGLFNVVTAGFTVTVLLPSVGAGFWCRVRRSGATGSVGINAGAGNIDGSTTYTLPGDRKCVTLYCLSANNWTIIAQS